MICGKIHFKRVVVSVGGTSPPQMVRFAADLARQFGLELCGLFLEDTRLLELARLPFLREFRPLAGGWHPLDTARLSEELETTRRMAERAFAEITRQLHATSSRFEVVSGATAEMLATLSPSGDLLVIDLPASPDVEAGRATAVLIDQAFRSADAVMLLPRRIVRTFGPVVAIGETRDDPVMAAASQIAQALGETMVTVDLPSAPGEGETEAAAIRALGAVHERMVVLRYRHAGAALAQHLASIRCVPVLVLDHDSE